MVTGVETAGLVLATIPLIICALENYESTIGPTKAFIRWKGNLAIAKNELYVLYAAFDQTLRVLLTPIAGPEDLMTMIEDTTSDLWKKGDIAEDLEHHLGLAYLAVMLEIERIAGDLLDIVKHLNIAGAQQVSQQGLRAIIQFNPPTCSTSDPRKRYFFRERVKFTMKRQALKEKMTAIQKGIETLTSFAERAEKLDDGPSTNSKSKVVKFTAPLNAIRDNASRVHKVLIQRYCMSHKRHRAAILLEDRMLRRKRGRIVNKTQVASDVPSTAACFTLCLDEHLPASKWISTEFRIIESSTSTKSKVNIAIASTTSSVHTYPYSDPSTLVEVAEICSYLQQRTDPAIGFCLDDCHKLRAYPGQLATFTHEPQGMTLAQILPQLPRRLASGDIYQLAVVLTATVLQLIETPWLDNGSWNKDGILFTRLCSTASGNLDIKYPLLLRDFTTGNWNALRSPTSKDIDDAASPCLTRSTTASATQTRIALLSLGIMLLEINSGKPLESFRTPQDLGNKPTPDDSTDFITAHRWLLEQEAQGSLSYGFSTAITNCLQVYLNPRANCCDAEFCGHIQDNVIKPLEDEMQFLRHGV